MGLFFRGKRKDIDHEEIAISIFKYFEEIYASEKDNALATLDQFANYFNVASYSYVSKYTNEVGSLLLFLTITEMGHLKPVVRDKIWPPFLYLISSKGYKQLYDLDRFMEYEEELAKAINEQRSPYEKISFAALRNCFGRDSDWCLPGMIILFSRCHAYTLNLRELLKDIGLL